jgi:hypothetical protein
VLRRRVNAPVKTDMEDDNLVDLPKGQVVKSGLNKSILDVASGSIYSGAQICRWEMR